MGIRTGALLVSLAVAATLTLASPARACSCAGGRTAAQEADAADVVFVGRVEAKRTSGYGGSGTVTWTIAVESVLKGDVARRQAVSSSDNGASCGATLDTHGWYLVLAYVSENGKLGTNLCSGNRTVAPHYVPTTFGTVSQPRPGSAGDVAEPRWPVALALVAVTAAGAAVLATRRAPQRAR
jgi:hypothetical protein